MHLSCHSSFFNDLLFILDIESLIRYGGLMALSLLIFGSSGLFFCFIIPSGAVLFTAGVFVATGDLQYGFYTVCTVLTLASILGNMTGYWFGLQTGPSLYKWKDSKFFRKQFLRAAEEFYEKYGGRALIIAFFLPVIRTFAPIVAGMIRMNFRRFMLATLGGSLLSIFLFVSAGYLIGSWPFLKPWLRYIVFLFLLIVTLPLVIRIVRDMRKTRKARSETTSSE